jgi:hypothetical protein
VAVVETGVLSLAAVVMAAVVTTVGNFVFQKI